jgi:hypothetical protein
MKLTFGICTRYDFTGPRLLEVIESIRALKIPEYEIIIAGSPPGETLVSSDHRHLQETDCYYLHTDGWDGCSEPVFRLSTTKEADCSHFSTRGWITRKKNLIAKYAKYNTLVLLHDYFVFDPQWYQAFEEFGYDWDICCCPQTLMNGKRHFTDWVADAGGPRPIYTMIDYTDNSYTKHQYISGGMFLVKKYFLLMNPFAEWMAPGTAEDVEWSRRVREKARILCNPGAKVRHNKSHRDNR